ncbi:MAG: undecaprenyl-phosphate glucose phosphotransferase [Lachnospiraceae bacterium]|nr:undecaprenyl-phosphate glucose phosphotransferase [Lachnospiraceae bacterium]
MIKDNQKHLNRVHVVLDALIIVVSYLLAWWIQFTFLADPKAGKLPMQTYLMALLFVVPGYLLLYDAFHLYKPKRVSGRMLEAGNLFLANMVGLLGFIFVLFIIKESDFSRGLIFIFTLINFLLTLCERNFIRIVLKDIRSRGMNLKHMILVGYSSAADGYIDRIFANPQWGYQIDGILDDNSDTGRHYHNIPVIGNIDDIGRILDENALDEIAITLGLSEYSKLKKIVAACEKSGVHTQFVPDYTDIIPSRPYTEDLLGLPVINIRYVPLSDTFNALIKRLMDIIGSLLAIVLFSPVMLITAIAIKRSSPGPLIFSQERVGLHNRPFRMYKFRSMRVQTDDEERQGWTMKNDPRVTKVGKVIRKTSIDELPQLFNVLKGNMSLIGPRPERPQYVEKFREEIPRYMVKHQVRPGMTGWAQVNGYRGNTSIRKRIEYDIYYIENWSVAFDIKILVLTVFKGFINRNAY